MSRVVRLLRGSSPAWPVLALAVVLGVVLVVYVVNPTRPAPPPALRAVAAGARGGGGAFAARMIADTIATAISQAVSNTRRPSRR